MWKLVRMALVCGALCLTACGEKGGGTTPCEEGTWTCSDEGYVLRQCVGGSWTETRCMEDQGKLCEAGTCVDPWRHGSPEWDRCEGEPLAAPGTLAAKMTYYEDVARRLHVQPPLRWMLGVTLACREVTCSGGDTPPCYDCSQPAVPQEEATVEHVVQWHTGENDGLWSSLYLTSQAYRYAVTGDGEALSMLVTLLEGQRDRMAITGVRGLFTRQLIPPDMPGIGCPEDPAEYVPDEEKNDNQWVRIGPDGCVQTADPVTHAFVSSSHCGLNAFAGWCWLDNVSQDEYSGHVLALADTEINIPESIETPGRRLEPFGDLLELNEAV